LPVVIASTPRSGNTWLRLVLAEALGFDQLAVHHPAELHGELPEETVVQVHWPPVREFVSVIEAADAAVLTLVRHPLDVLVSIVEFTQFSALTALWLQGDGGNEEALVGAAPNDEAVVEYALSDRFRCLLAVSYDWTQRGIVVRYEELVRDPLATVKGVVAKVGGDGSSVREAVANNTFARLHRIDPTHHFRGTPGGWRSFLTAATAEKIIGSLDDVYLAPYRSDLAVDPSLDDAAATRRWQAELHKSGRNPSLEVQSRIASLVAYVRKLNEGRVGFKPVHP